MVKVGWVNRFFPRLLDIPFFSPRFDPILPPGLRALPEPLRQFSSNLAPEDHHERPHWYEQTLGRDGAADPARAPDDGHNPLAGVLRKSDLGVREIGSVGGSLRHLYQDLGVLVFAGVSAQQAGRIGDILKRIVEAGGPEKALITTTRAVPSSRSHMTWAIPENLRLRDKIVQHPQVTITRWLGNLPPHTIVKMAREHVRNHVAHEVGLDSFDPKRLTVQVKEVSFPPRPRPRSILFTTINGDRRLPVTSHASITSRPGGDPFDLSAHVQFISRGRGMPAGTAVVHIRVRVRSESTGLREPWKPGPEPGPEPVLHEGRTSGWWDLCEHVFEPLWMLEREVYADKWVKWMEETGEEQMELAREKTEARTMRRDEQRIESIVSRQGSQASDSGSKRRSSSRKLESSR